MICGGSAICFGGRAGYRSFIDRFSGPGTLPSNIMYDPRITPYLMKPPFGVISFPSVPIFRIRLLRSVLWWKPICPALGTLYITCVGFHGPKVAMPLFVFLALR